MSEFTLTGFSSPQRNNPYLANACPNLTGGECILKLHVRLKSRRLWQFSRVVPIESSRLSRSHLHSNRFFKFNKSKSIFLDLNHINLVMQHPCVKFLSVKVGDLTAFGFVMRNFSCTAQSIQV